MCERLNVTEGLKELKAHLDSMISFVKELLESLSAEQAESTTEEKTIEPQLALEDVRSLLAAKSRDGHTTQVKALLKKYGANRLSEVDPANYKTLYQEAEGIGNEQSS